MKFIDLPDTDLPHSIFGDDPRFGLERHIRDMPGYDEGEPVTIIGPADGDFTHCGPPRIRPAKVSDFKHNCRVCKRMRRRVRAGKEVLVADFSQSLGAGK
jgi:hypothetical protein